MPLTADLARHIYHMETMDDVLEAYDFLSGELHASVSGLLMEDSSLRSDAVLQRLHSLADRLEYGSYGLLEHLRFNLRHIPLRKRNWRILVLRTPVPSGSGLVNMAA